MLDVGKRKSKIWSFISLYPRNDSLLGGGQNLGDLQYFLRIIRIIQPILSFFGSYSKETYYKKFRKIEIPLHVSALLLPYFQAVLPIIA
jgi:hypothetical protein